MVAQIAVLLKLASNIDPILYALGLIAVVYLVVLGILYWKRNFPDQWQRLLAATGIPKLVKWVSEKLHLGEFKVRSEGF